MGSQRFFQMTDSNNSITHTSLPGIRKQLRYLGLWKNNSCLVTLSVQGIPFPCMHKAGNA